jgi:probable blue pigment (indigoidine) exporter
VHPTDATRSTAGVSTVTLLAVLGLLWGATFPIVRFGVAAGASPMFLVAVDLLLAAGIMAPVAVATRHRRDSARSLVESVFLGTLLIGGNNLFLFWAMEYTTGGAGAIVYATSPLLSVVLIRASGGAVRLGKVGTSSLAIGFGGVLLLGFSASGTAIVTSGVGLAALVAGVVCQATGAVLVGRRRPTGESAWGQMAQFSGGGLVALAAATLFEGSHAFPLSAPVVLSVLYFSILTAAVGYTIYFELIRRAGAVRANVVNFLNPVVALLLGVGWFAEPFAPAELLGLALVLAALLGVQLGSRPPNPVPEAAVGVGV